MALGLLALAGGTALGGAALASRSTPDKMQEPTGYGANQMQIVQELLRRHNSGELDLPDEQVKQLSQLAANLGMKFEAESKPFKKLMFDAADTALFGLIPDEFSPHSIGQELHGESWVDRTAGTLGTVGGLVASGGLLLKGGKMALGGIKGWMGKGSAAANAQRSWANSQPGGLMNMFKLTPGSQQTGGLLGAPSMAGFLPPGAINLGQGIPSSIPLGMGKLPGFGQGLNRGGTPLMSILQTGF